MTEQWSNDNWIALELVNILFFSALSCYHGWSLGKLGFRWTLLPAFHTLSLIGFLATLPAQCVDLSCFLADSPICGNWTNVDADSKAVQVLVMSTYNLGFLALNANFAMIAFFTRKEIVYARHGPSRWPSSRKPIGVFCCILAALGLLFFLNYSSHIGITEVGWLNVTSSIVIWIGVFVRNATVGAAIVQVAVLTCTLHYSQRVLPFMNTRLLLLAILLAAAHSVLQTLSLLSPVLENEEAQVPLAWLGTLCAMSGNSLLAYLFREGRDASSMPLL